MPKICIVPRVEGLAGVASFRLKFEDGLRARGLDTHYDPGASCDAVLILAGTRKLLPLCRAHRQGKRIVQRLDGINWVHRRRNTGLKHYLRAEYGNLVLSLIRSRIADGVIYQSEFVRKWWDDWYGEVRAPATVIHNGVDLGMYAGGNAVPHHPPYRLLLVEGSLGGGYEMGLDSAVALAERLQEQHGLAAELAIVGKITGPHQARVTERARVPIRWLGVLSRERIPDVMRSAHLLFSADLHPACPNSVIEALACGLPVVAFDTGAIPELVVGDSGKVVPYGGDSWRMEMPDIPALAEAAAEILENQARFRKAARSHAESALGLDKMVDEYLKVLL